MQSRLHISVAAYIQIRLQVTHQASDVFEISTCGKLHMLFFLFVQVSSFSNYRIPTLPTNSETTNTYTFCGGAALVID